MLPLSTPNPHLSVEVCRGGGEDFITIMIILLFLFLPFPQSVQLLLPGWRGRGRRGPRGQPQVLRQRQRSLQRRDDDDAAAAAGQAEGEWPDQCRQRELS